ncbi:MAG: type III pantothenate kinase [Verrucomicrobiota bacterium]|nr:type III pantothenate kinase [Verrucomicrobiota bacterium]
MDDEPIFARSEATHLQIAPQVRYLTSVRLRSEVAHRGDDKLLADRYQQFIHQACVRDAATDFGPGTNTNGQIYQRGARTICETTLATASPSGGGQDRQHLRCLLGGAEKKRRGPESGATKQDFVVNAASPARGWNRLSKSEKNWADRLANAAAVAAIYGCPAIVVDFGTAVTFDIVSAQRKYIGGVIAPGLESMTNFLYQRTALLPKLSLQEPRSAVGRSTIEAMRSGAVIGYRGLVREIIARIKTERFPRKQVHVIATGGYADLIAARLHEVDAVHPNLTLEGLRIIANLNL